MARPWNWNIHYDARLAARIPAAARSVVDVGCGDGFLAARLAARIPTVVALDVHEPVLARARARFPHAPVTWVHADLLSGYPVPGAPFDAVVSNATLHHFTDVGVALARLRGLVAAGGVLAVVTFTRMERRELVPALAGRLTAAAGNLARRKWEHTAPIAWPPGFSLRELRAIAAHELPGVRLTRLLAGRSLLLWQAPRDTEGP